MREHKYSDFVYTERLRAARYVKKISIAKMAEFIGYNSPSSYKYIEEGVVEPKISIMKKVAQALSQPVGYFFNLEVQEDQTKIN